MLVLEVGDHRQTSPGFEAEALEEGDAWGVAFEEYGDDVFEAEVGGGMEGVADEVGAYTAAVGVEVDIVADFGDGFDGVAAGAVGRQVGVAEDVVGGFVDEEWKAAVLVGFKTGNAVLGREWCGVAGALVGGDGLVVDVCEARQVVGDGQADQVVGVGCHVGYLTFSEWFLVGVRD